MSQLTLEHQRKEIATDRGGMRYAVLRPEHNLRGQSKDFPINGGADYRRHIFVIGDKGSGYHDVITGLSAALGNPLARSVDLATPHDRACSETSTRDWRISRLRCFRKIAPSLASLARLRSLSAYWRSAARLRGRADDSLKSSRSFDVASSMAIVFMEGL